VSAAARDVGGKKIEAGPVGLDVNSRKYFGRSWLGGFWNLNLALLYYGNIISLEY
jgi:hypothetical protein